MIAISILPTPPDHLPTPLNPTQQGFVSLNIFNKKEKNLPSERKATLMRLIELDKFHEYLTKFYPFQVLASL